MLPKSHRLPGYLIPAVLKKGRTIQSDLFILSFVKGYQNTQFAFIVSTKLDKRAVVRNRIKRRLSEAVRSLLPQIKPGLAVIILAKKEILKADFQEIKNVVARFIAPEIKVP